MAQTELAKLLELQLASPEAPKAESPGQNEMLAQAIIGLAPILAGAALGGARGGATGAQAGMVGLEAVERGRKEKEAKAEKQTAAEKEAKKEAIKTALELSKEQRAEGKYQEEMGLKRKELSLKEQELARKAAETKQLPAAQYAAGGYARRLEQAEQVFDRLAEQGYSRAESSQRLSGILPKELQSDARQANDQAERNFVNAILRRESGAAISSAEFENAQQQYFPRPGDSPDVVAQKKANRQQAMASLQAEAGKALQQIPLVSVPAPQKKEPSPIPSVPGGVTEANAGGMTDRQKRIQELRKKLGK
jgi:hypothetical protein